MTETMKMINIINQNKIKHQNILAKNLKINKRKELLSNIFLSISSIIAFIGIVFFMVVVNGIMFA